MQRPANYWHMLPEAAQARKAIWESVNPHTGKRRIDEAFPHEIRETTRENEMLIKFHGGSTWQVVGSDNFNSLIGASPAGITYSEWAVAKPSARAFLRPIIAENNGWELFIYTPRGRNHGLRTLEAARKTPGAFAQVLDAASTGALTPERLEFERQGYINEYGKEDGEAIFRQEYFCDFSAAIHGAILARYIDSAEREGRISDDVAYDGNGSPVFISSDIGYRDTACWWFWQPRIDGFALIDYLEFNGKDAEESIDILDERLRRYKLGKIWLPHDARAQTFQTRYSVIEQFAKHFGVNHIDVVPQTKKQDQINAARVVLSSCYFNRTLCMDGIEGLNNWAFEWDDDRKEFSKLPRHDVHSHPADAFCYGAQMILETKPAAPSGAQIKKTRIEMAIAKAIKPLTFSEAIKLQDQRDKRRRRARV